MRAVVHHRYGPPDILHVEEVEPPTSVAGRVVVRVHATTVNRGDCHRRSGRPFFARLIGPFFGTQGLFGPTRPILGGEFAGVVQEIGADVTEFEPGDRVFGTNIVGAHAELVSVRALGPIAHMPDGASFEEAAAVSDGAIIAIGPLRKAGIAAGLDVLVYGATGSIGTASVQLCRHFGAHVTAVCNTKNLELVRSLGADDVIDYTRDDFRTNGKTYDIVMDAVGRLTFRHCRRSLKPGGRFIPTDGLANAFWWLWTRRFGDKKVVLDLPPKYTRDVLLFVKELIEAGEYRAVIDRTYPLEQVVEATRYVETGQKTGNVVLIVDGGDAR